MTRDPGTRAHASLPGPALLGASSWGVPGLGEAAAAAPGGGLFAWREAGAACAGNWAADADALALVDGGSRYLLDPVVPALEVRLPGVLVRQVGHGNAGDLRRAHHTVGLCAGGSWPVLVVVARREGSAVGWLEAAPPDVGAARAWLGAHAAPPFPLASLRRRLAASGPGDGGAGGAS